MAPRSWERQHSPSGHTPLDHTPASTHHLVLKSANRLTQTMKKQFHFRNQPLTTKRPTYYSTNITLFLEQTQNLILNPPSNPDLVIKLFNKGSGICLIDTLFHISKIEEHPVDPSNFKGLSSNPTQAIRKDVISTLNYLYHTHQINDVTRHHLTPPMPARIPLFYGIPKVHKPNIPLLPIVSACDSPTKQLSNYVTHFIQPLVEILSSYIRDSKHFPQLLESVPPLPENAILLTADVTSLYTNMRMA